MNIQREISRKIPKLPPSYRGGGFPLFTAYGCVLLERDTGKTYVYTAVNLQTGRVETISRRSSPLTTSSVEAMAERIRNSKVAGAGQLEADRQFGEEIGLSKCRKMLHVMFNEILPQHGYNIRAEQISLAEHILGAIDRHNISLAEAEVGTGKTLAYLVPAILAKRGRLGGHWNMGLYTGSPFVDMTHMPIVVATSSISLQKAIVTDYIPELSKIMLQHGIIKSPLTAVLRKGREHYICTQNLQAHVQFEQNPKMKRILTGLLKPNAPIDLADVEGLTPYIKRRICVPDRCYINCPHRNSCAYLKFRKYAQSPEIDIQVCNHNYLLADILRRADNQRPLIPNYQSLGEFVIAKYIRLSIEDAKSESMSIENQRLLLDGHIESLNLPNCRVLEFEDNGYTGTNFERPRVQELLDLVQAGGVNCVIVKDFSRFGRNSIEMGYFLERVFPLCRVRFISVDDHYDSAEHDGDTGGLEVAFKFLVHEQYSKDLSRKITASKHEKMRRGEAVYGMFGYRKVDGVLEIDEPAADSLRRIYALVLEGKNYGQISEIMYAEKRKTPAAHKSGAEDYIWNKSQIFKFLRDEQYVGTYLAGKTRTIEIGSGKQIKVPKEDWVRIENHHPPVVDKETFDAVQNKLNSRSAPLRGRKVSTDQRYANLRTSPLKGKVICATCGHRMKLSTTRNSAFHCAYTLAAPDKTCHKLKVDARELEATVLRKLREQATAFDGDELPLLPHISQHRLEIVALEDEKRTLYEQFVEGGVSRDDFKARNAKLSADIEELQRIQTAIESQTKKQSAMQSGGIALKQADETLKGRRTLTEEIVAALIDKVRVHPDGTIEIDWTTK